MLIIRYQAMGLHEIEEDLEGNAFWWINGLLYL